MWEDLKIERRYFTSALKKIKLDRPLQLRPVYFWFVRGGSIEGSEVKNENNGLIQEYTFTTA